MRSISLDRVERFRRAMFPLQAGEFGWRVASVAVSMVSVILIALTVGYKLHGAEPPSPLLLALLFTFATVVLLLSRFLRVASHEGSQTRVAFNMSESEFKSVFENALDAILILDDQAICREANPAAEQLFGLERKELIGRPIGHVYKDPARFKEAWGRLLSRAFQQGEAELVRSRETSVFVEYSAKANCLPGQHVVILRDITERRRAQRSLLDSEERFQQMARNIQEIFWMIDAESKKVLFVSPAYETITGRSPQSLMEDPTSYEEVIHPEDRVHVLIKLDEATRTGQLNERFRIVRLDGTIRWVWVRGFPVREASGKISRLVGTALEITAQKDAEEEAEALRKATLALTQDLRMDYVMDTLLKSLAELVPYTCARVLVPEGGPWVQALGEKIFPEPDKRPRPYSFHLNADESPFLQRIVSEQKSILIADTRQEKDWQTFKGHKPLRSWLSVPLVASGQYLGFLSVGHNEPERFTEEHLRRAQLLAIPAAAAIQNARLYQTARIYGSELEKRFTELKQAEAALAESQDSRKISEEKFQKVFRSSPVPFSITTLDEGRFLDVNAAFEQRYGYPRDEVLGRTVHDLKIWEDPADRAFMLAQLKKGGPIRNVIARLRMKSGEVKLTSYSAEKVQFDGQACILAVSQDVLEYDPHSSN